MNLPRFFRKENFLKMDSQEIIFMNLKLNGLPIGDYDMIILNNKDENKKKW